MIDNALLDILVCPETKQALRPADKSLLGTLNASISAGAVTTRGGETLSEAVAEGLVRDDGSVLYQVRDGIPIMLIDESIPLPRQA